jgi:mannose-6-phosphate isomerase-like protein (cupin superfamily)
MINRYYKKGQKLDVAGLNEITVLVDRSETELSEIGWNSWRPNLDGPPHKHNDKDQIFYVTDGVGKVKLGDDVFDVKPGDLAYVPAGLVHQTITTTEVPLSYMLFNIFNGESKEGHASFADHIEKVKMIRKKQAETGNYNVAEENVLTDIKPGKFINDIYSGKRYEFGSNSTILLLDRNETNRCELTVVSWPSGSRGALVAHKEKEQTFFVLRGNGRVTVGTETENVNPGSVVFVPRNTPHTTEAVGSELAYLCMNGLVDKDNYSSFEEMYNAVAPGRIKRWKAGSTQVGD